MLQFLLSFLFLIEKGLSIRNMTIFGNSTLGYYYLEAFVGSPPQKKALILDTGSHMTIFPCEGCSKCRNHMNPIFKYSNSTTFEKVNSHNKYFGWKCEDSIHSNCNFKQGYTEGSEYSGYFAVDNFLFENELKSKKDVKYNHIFGCALKETGEFFSQEADGIIGFGVTRKGNNPPTILDIEKSEKRIENLIFSVCVAKDGGELSFGDWNKNLHLKNAEKKFIDIKNMNWEEQYKVPLNNIKVGDLSVDYNFDNMNSEGGKAFFDTGTTFVYFDHSLFSKFTNTISLHCQQKETNCAGKNVYEECFFWNKRLFPTENDFMNTFPMMTFDFNGTEMFWYPQDYFVVPLDGTNHFCIGVKPLKNAILGAVLMRNYDIYFDRTKKRIGFSRSNCGQISDFDAIFSKFDENSQNKNLNKKKQKIFKKISHAKKGKFAKNKKNEEISKKLRKKEIAKKLKLQKKQAQKKAQIDQAILSKNQIEAQLQREKIINNVFVGVIALFVLLMIILFKFYKNNLKKEEESSEGDESMKKIKEESDKTK